jgi:hypothetical protein
MARQQAGAVVFSLLVAVLLCGCLPAPAAAGVHLSTLPKALAVTASPKSGQGAPARIAFSLHCLSILMPMFPLVFYRLIVDIVQQFGF